MTYQKRDALCYNQTDFDETGCDSLENLTLSVRVVFPMFFMLALGYGIQRARIVSEEVLDGCSALVFQVILPIHMFMSITKTTLEEALDVRLLLLTAGTTVGFWLLGMLVIPRLEPDNRKRGSMIQGVFRSNYVLFGSVIADTIAGPAAAGLSAMVVAVAVPIYNVLSVVTLEFFRGGKPNAGNILRGIAKNPLILSAIFGLLWLLTGLKLPALLNDTLNDVAKIATPLAIIALGGTFHFSALRGNRRQLGIVLAGKLLVMPALVIGVGVLAGLRGSALAVLLGTCATPTAVSSFPMAQKMGADGALAGQIVVLNTVFSIVTLFLWVLVLTDLGLV